jgi:alkylation response protein AidB-like acyl-CoA dehydrogenase
VDPSLTQEQEAFRRAVRDFAEDTVAPTARGRSGGVPLELVRRMGELGLFGLPFPSTYGGLDGDLLTFCVCLEELGRVDRSAASALATAVCLAANAVFRLGTEDQRGRWLTPLARGLAIGAAARVDPRKGVSAVARRQGDGWVLDGPPVEAANAGLPLVSLCVVPARAEATGRVVVLVVPTDAPGLEIDPIGPGLERRVVLAGCRVPADRALGTGEDALEGVLAILDEARVAEAAVETGVALAAGRPVGSVDAVRSAYRRAARLRDHGRPFRSEAAAAAALAERLGRG